MYDKGTAAAPTAYNKQNHNGAGLTKNDNVSKLITAVLALKPRPAPIYFKKYSADLNSKVAKTVALFNAELKKYSQKHSFNLVDVFHIYGRKRWVFKWSFSLGQLSPWSKSDPRNRTTAYLKPSTPLPAQRLFTFLYCQPLSIESGSGRCLV